jgi:hypothetical protein
MEKNENVTNTKENEKEKKDEKPIETKENEKENEKEKIIKNPSLKTIDKRKIVLTFVR